MRRPPRLASAGMIPTQLLLLALAASTAHAMRPPRSLDRPLWLDPGAAAASATLLPKALAPADPHDADWVGMPLPSINGTANCAVEFDGRLYIGGTFGAAGETRAPFVVAWDGSHFASAGDPGFQVQALVVWRGSLCAGGGTGGAARVSRWTGQEWESLGIGVSLTSPGVNCLEVFNGDLIVGGNQLDSMNGVHIESIARYDGTSWQSMGTGIDSLDEVIDLRAVGSELYASVDPFLGVIYHWDGSSWQWMALTETYCRLATDGTSLYRTGERPGTYSDSRPPVQKWLGPGWQGLGSTPGGVCFSVQWWNGQLVGAVDGHLSGFDGQNWIPFADAFASKYSVVTLTTFGDKLVALGSFSPASEGDIGSVATFDGTQWSVIGEPWSPEMTGVVGSTQDATVWNDQLVVVGNFGYVGTGSSVISNACEAAWNGSGWSRFADGHGVGPGPVAITSWADGLAVAGSFYDRSDPDFEIYGAGHWTGTAWEQLPDLPGPAYAVAEHLGELYAGGDFVSTIPGAPLVRIARWDGTTWQQVGPGLQNGTAYPGYYASVNALATWNGLLAAGGNFRWAGVVSAQKIALWNGTQWSAAGLGLDGDCDALESWNGLLVAGGEFTHAGGLTAPGAAFWDGAEWHAMGDRAVSVTDFGQVAGVLYAVGEFRRADGSVSNTVARWTGTDWALLGSGVAGTDELEWITGYHDDLYAGGRIQFAFGKVSQGIIRLPNANAFPVTVAPSPRLLSLSASSNPGRGAVTLAFALPKSGHVRLAVYDAAGRTVATLVDGVAEAGPHEARWTSAAAPGVYFARLDAPGGERRTARLVRLE